jgi:hypothetical protein
VKITLEGVTRVLDLEHVKLKQAMVIQEYTGLTVFAWQERLVGVSTLDAATESGPADEDPAVARARLAAMLRRSPMFTDPAWITSVAAAHWLMLAQAGEDPPPLDDDYDCDVLGFYLALFTAFGEEVKAKRVPDKPGPPGRPARRTPSSRQTAGPKKPITVTAVKLSAPIGS